MKRGRGSVTFVIGLVIYALLWLAALELNKNALWGWAVALALLVGYALLYRNVLGSQRWFVKLGGFLLLTVLLALNLSLSQGPVKRRPAVEGENPAVTDVVTVAQGQLTGVYTQDGAVEVYTGIPYAAPPVGELRWREPQDPAPWEGVLAADHFAPMSMQVVNSNLYSSLAQIIGYHDYEISLKDNFRDAVSEDSLYLNIWKPSGQTEKLPVLVYIHGGSLTTGQSYYGDHSGEILARDGILVVSITYRLGVFGYYADEALAAESPNGSTGNYGLLDQIRALQWVHDNIAAFGGDPENVTIAGESAGASSVNALCASPLTEGLFRRAIAESSGITAKIPYHTFRTMEQALETGKAIQQEFGAADAQALRTVPADKLVKTRHVNDSMTVDGFAIPEQPYLSYQRRVNHETALLQGFNVHEADFFCMGCKVDAERYVETLRPLYGDGAEAAAAAFPASPQEPFYHYLIDPGGSAKGSYNACVSAAWFAYSHYNWARLLHAQQVPVYTYYFTKNNGGMGCNHAGELPYFFGKLNRSSGNYDESDYVLSDAMRQYYVNFVKTGDPNGPGLPTWPEAAEAPDQVLELGTEIRVIPDPYLALYPLIDQFMDQK